MASGAGPNPLLHGRGLMGSGSGGCHQCSQQQRTRRQAAEEGGQTAWAPQRGLRRAAQNVAPSLPYLSACRMPRPS
jgi:primosomal protein N'